MEMLLFSMLLLHFAATESVDRKTKIESYVDVYRNSESGESFLVASMIQCSQKCLASTKPCTGANFNTEKINGLHQCEIVHTSNSNVGLQTRVGWIHMAAEIPEANEEGKQAQLSCKDIKDNDKTAENGVYLLASGGREFQAYCDMANGGFTLVARFSNADAMRWMVASGELWYNNETFGQTQSSTQNEDMVSLAFAAINGSDIKVSRSDDNNHTALLLASGCLGGISMRKKITSYGNFRNGAEWQRNACLGNCSATFSGQYSTTAGFKHATSTCTASNDILNGYHIGFWCHYNSGDGAVIMIGGGGPSCDRADHGIGITEANTPILGGSIVKQDFGNDASKNVSAYALNLWVR